jgi:hypothetical protein
VLCERLGCQRKEVTVGRREYHNKEFHDFICGQNLLGLSYQRELDRWVMLHAWGGMHTCMCFGCKSEVARPFRHRKEGDTEKELIELECVFVQECN